MVFCHSEQQPVVWTILALAAVATQKPLRNEHESLSSSRDVKGRWNFLPTCYTQFVMLYSFRQSRFLLHIDMVLMLIFQEVIWLVFSDLRKLDIRATPTPGLLLPRWLQHIIYLVFGTFDIVEWCYIVDVTHFWSPLVFGIFGVKSDWVYFRGMCLGSVMVMASCQSREGIGPSWGLLRGR